MRIITINRISGTMTRQEHPKRELTWYKSKPISEGGTDFKIVFDQAEKDLITKDFLRGN